MSVFPSGLQLPPDKPPQWFQILLIYSSYRPKQHLFPSSPSLSFLMLQILICSPTPVWLLSFSCTNSCIKIPLLWEFCFCLACSWKGIISIPSTKKDGLIANSQFSLTHQRAEIKGQWSRLKAKERQEPPRRWKYWLTCGRVWETETLDTIEVGKKNSAKILNNLLKASVD